MPTDLQSRFQSVQNRINNACQKAGRSPASVELIAVSKGQDIAKIREMYTLGVRDFGENYQQGLEKKSEALSDLSDIRWHFLGGIQSNKLQKIIEHCTSIHTVSNARHAEMIAQIAKKLGKAPFPIYLQVNIGAEGQKQGAEFSMIKNLAELIYTKLPELTIEGVMAVPPASYSDATWPSATLPPPYESLRNLAQTVGAKKLSLGMSADLGLAIKAQSTCLRIGRDLFGERA